MKLNSKEICFMMDNAKTLCEEHGVKLLFVSTCGSKAYGYNEKDSDQDITFVYYRNPIEYFTISDLPTNIKHPTLDIKGYDITKYLGIMAKSGWNVYEMLYTVAGTSGNEHMTIINDLRELAAECFCPEKMAHAMASTAFQCFEKFEKAILTRDRVKQLLSAARFIFSSLLILDKRIFPPTNFKALLESMEKTLINVNPDIVCPCCFTSVFYTLMCARRDGDYNYIERMIPLSEMEIVISVLKDLQLYALEHSVEYECNMKKNRELCDKFLQEFIKKEYSKTL